MTKDNHQPAAAHKASFRDIYNDQDPRGYLTTLASLEYTIPQQVEPLFQRLYELSCQDRESPAILDVCCSYGINGCLLKYDVNLDTWTTHYHGSKLSPKQQTLADKEFFTTRAKSCKPVVLGLDKADQAIRYAVSVGLIDDGWAEDLEVYDPSPGLSKALQDVKLITCTGGASYVGPRTFRRIMAAIPKSRNVWMASTVIRMVPYDDIATALKEYGLVTERLPDVVLHQRRFASAQEQSDVATKVAARGLDTSGFENEGYLCAEVYVSRPITDINSPPIAELVETFNGAQVDETCIGN